MLEVVFLFSFGISYSCLFSLNSSCHHFGITNVYIKCNLKWHKNVWEAINPEPLCLQDYEHYITKIVKI